MRVLRRAVLVLGALLLACGSSSTRASPPRAAHAGESPPAPVEAKSAVVDAGSPLAASVVDAGASEPAENGVAPKEARLPAPAVVNPFAWALHRELAKRGGNVVASPLGVSVTFAMAYLGARGKTADEMQKAFHYPAADKLADAVGFASFDGAPRGRDGEGKTFGGKPPTLRIASRLWPDAAVSLDPKYAAEVARLWRAAVVPLPLDGDPKGASASINAWAERETAGKITTLVTPETIPHPAALVLTNAVYFRASWMNPFSHDATTPAPFFAAAGASRDVATMHARRIAAIANVDDATVLELPCDSGGTPFRFVLDVVLPKAQAGLAAIEKRWSADTLDGLAFGDALVNMAIPKVHLESTLPLVTPLGALGVRAAFTPGAGVSPAGGAADFGGIAPNVALSGALQKATIDIDEKGTEASAATAVYASLTSAPNGKPLEFKADHPFLFVLRDAKSKAIVFMGRVTDP